MPYTPAGVIPAVLLPFHEDLSIDESSYRAHLRDVASVAGLSAITVNAHASEVASCTFDEQRRVLELSCEEVELPIVNGVYADGSLEAARIAKMAERGGAAGVLGCSGLLSGSGSVIADLQAKLFRAVRAGDMTLAKELHDRITPTAEVFYAEPWVDMHNRMKEALVLLGKLPRAVVRPPLAKLSAQEIERIRAALVAAGLLDAKTSHRRVA